MNRAVITGIGVKSPVGNNVSALWQSIKSGKHGISTIADSPRFDEIKPFPEDIKVAAFCDDFDPLEYFDKKELRRTDRYTQFACAAARDALADAESEFSEDDPYKIGVIIGSGVGGIQTLQDQHTNYMNKGPERVSVFFIPMMISNMAAGQVAINCGFKGSNFAPITACATSAHAVGEAFRNIKHGYLDVCLAGGSESAITGFALAGFNNMQALSKSADPDRASIPFDAERGGFVMGEGAAVLVLESLDHAVARGAKIYAEVVGYGSTCDAYHITSPSPSGDGAAKAMTLAIEEAGITPADVSYVNAHGTSTGLNDKYETIAIKTALGESAKSVAVSSTKSMTGHMLGAAGAIESAICALALKDGVIPPTVGYKTPDPECDLDVVPNTARAAELSYTLSNSLGFGGHNASICLKKY